MMDTHRMCVVVVSNLLSTLSQLIAHGASQCFSLSQGTKGRKRSKEKETFVCCAVKLLKGEDAERLLRGKITWNELAFSKQKLPNFRIL